MRKLSEILFCLLFCWSVAYSSKESYTPTLGQTANKSQIDILSNNSANKSIKGFVAKVPSLKSRTLRKNTKKPYFTSLYNLSFKQASGSQESVLSKKRTRLTENQSLESSNIDIAEVVMDLMKAQKPLRNRIQGNWVSRQN